MNECYVGEIKNNNFGTPMKIVAINRKSDICVQFLDEFGYIKKHVTYQNFKRGQIKNPYDKTIFNVGYLGVGKYMARESSEGNTREYHIWHNILKRCYAEQHKEMYPAYYGVCTVCNEWLNFQNFAEWYHNNYYEVNERLHIDKDILFPGNKVYDLKHCILVPQKINALFICQINKSGLPNGIKMTNTGRYMATYNGKHLGTFDTMTEAYKVHAIAKERAIKIIAEEYRNIVPTKVYDALINYRMPKIQNEEEI